MVRIFLISGRASASSVMELYQLLFFGRVPLNCFDLTLQKLLSRKHSQNILGLRSEPLARSSLFTSLCLLIARLGVDATVLSAQRNDAPLQSRFLREAEYELGWRQPAEP